MQRIPLIDLGNNAGLAGEVEKACRDIGFMYVAGHGISQQRFDDVRTSVVDYFAQPVETKLRDRISPDNYRGYIPEGFFTANSNTLRGDLTAYQRVRRI